jgi:inorganic pyrophosphatase
MLVLVLSSAVVLGGTSPHPTPASQGCPAYPGLPAQPAGAPGELIALVEIPAGSSVKYELNVATGRMEVDRFLETPVAYPINYGMLPCTKGGDGDALDVLVVTRIPLVPGSLIRVRPIGVLPTIDGGEEDHKVLAVPLTQVDQSYDPITDYTNLPSAELARIRSFFQIYKTLPAGSKVMEVGEWQGAARARALISSALSTSRELPN